MATKVTVSFWSHEKVGDEVSRSEVELTEVEALIGGRETLCRAERINPAPQAHRARVYDAPCAQQI